ncbi:MAG: hypothetical protein M1482_10635 [Chloroflexi bacterium]|nr:hypothetical protein [Chloroflexota bacterium]
MISHDFETGLDQALAEALAADLPVPDTATNGEAGELVRVALRLQKLAPSPVPRLEKGRRRFLAEAGRLERQSAGLRGALRLGMFRPAFAIVSLAVALVLIGGAVFSAGSILAGLSTPPAKQALTPTTNPSFTATPTQISLAPVDWAMLASRRGQTAYALPAPPPPNPAPASATFGPYQTR